MNSKNVKLCTAVLISVFLAGCATKVTRVSVDEMIDLSGQWNDYDAMQTAQAMVDDALKARWLQDMAAKKGRNPVVIVGHVSNRSHEHINTGVITKYLERELLDSGKVIFVASSIERDQLRTEREDQQKGFTDPNTIAVIGREKGADVMLIGSINSVQDAIKGKYVILYQVNLEIIDLTDNTKLWIGQKSIKKKVENSKLKI